MLTTARRIYGKIMHPQTALHSQWDKGWKNNSQFASLSIRRPTVCSSLTADQEAGGMPWFPISDEHGCFRAF